MENMPTGAMMVVARLWPIIPRLWLLVLNYF